MSPQVLVVSKEWPQREDFLGLVEEELKRQNDERAYYPGARERRDAFLGKCGMKPLGSESDAVGFVRDVCDEVLEEEVFGPFLAVKEVDGGLLEAADFANQKCRGTLSCTVRGLGAGAHRVSLRHVHAGAAVGASPWLQVPPVLSAVSPP